MAVRFRRSGRFRRWLGAQFGHDEAWGDRLWRRIVHMAGAAILVYFILPNGFFVVAPKEAVLLTALAVVLVLETLRHLGGLELPTIREVESHRVASFAFYAVALVGAVLLAPLPIAATVVLGTAWVDPLAGELRASVANRRLYPAVPYAVYVVLAVLGLSVVGGWPLLLSVPLAFFAAALGLLAEYPKLTWLDDDLVMMAVPALGLYFVGVLVLGLPG